MDLTVVMRIKIGRMTIVICIYISKSLLKPLKPITCDSVTPAMKKRAMSPPKTSE
jgi:hypothetical protein